MLRHMTLRIACVLFIVALVPSTVAALPVTSAQQAGQDEWEPEHARAISSEEGPQQEVPPVETRLYPLQHVGVDSAYTLAVSACRENDVRSGTGCNVEVMREESTLVVTAIAAIHERVASLLREVDIPPHTQTFHIVVLAATDSPSAPSALPPGAQQAVEDIRAFLPYDGFRVLDTGWLKTARQGHTTLTGPTGFEVGLRFRGNPRSDEPILVEAFEMNLREESYSPNGELMRSHRLIVETSFSMDVGETVVVGTSKLNGENEPTALVILLTALEPEDTR